MRRLGLYIHIPFCKSKCIYCDFYSLAHGETQMDAYCTALCAQLRKRAAEAAEYEVDTVYFGGGTPSYFGAARLCRVLGEIRAQYRLTPDAEITLEANPDSARNESTLRTLRKAGFNRISLGMQSADNALLRTLGRIHTHADKSASADKGMGEVARYRLMWNHVVYEPGEVKAVAYDEKGNAVAESVVLTAGTPAKIALSADRDAISADGDDLVYITASVVDENGTVCPLADNRLFFSVYGDGELLTTDNGDQRETESFARHDKKVLAGKVVACVRSIKDQPGKLTLKVIADGIGAAEIDIDVK